MKIFTNTNTPTRARRQTHTTNSCSKNAIKLALMPSPTPCNGVRAAISIKSTVNIASGNISLVLKKGCQYSLQQKSVSRPSSAKGISPQSSSKTQYSLSHVVKQGPRVICGDFLRRHIGVYTVYTSHKSKGEEKKEGSRAWGRLRQERRARGGEGNVGDARISIVPFSH